MRDFTLLNFFSLSKLLSKNFFDQRFKINHVSDKREILLFRSQI